MYPEGYGDQAMDLLSRVKDEGDFKAMVHEFNFNNFKYTYDTLVFDRPRPDVELFFDMSENYFKFRFSDWVFIKNLSDEDVWFRLAGE
jgi:hypothetical protein